MANLYPRARVHIVFLWDFAYFRTSVSADPKDVVMLLQPGQSDRLRKLQGDVQRAQKVTRALMANVLSRGKQWPRPAWLDETVDVGHPILLLAILDATIEARAVAQASAAVAPRSVPPVRFPRDAAYLCRDNFARSP